MRSGTFDGAYEGVRALVTGNTGFKGSWLTTWLDRLGASVTGFALDPPTIPNAFEAMHLERRIDWHRGDVRDQHHVRAVIDHARPEVVFHLAAQPLVHRAWDEPHETLSTNVLGTVNVLDAAIRQPSVRAIVVVTSDKCYRNREWPWPYRETDALGGDDPYSASKACAELVVAAYRRPSLMGVQHDQPTIATVRAGNVIGGGDWAADRLLPDAARAFAAGEALDVRNPASVRPWQHVLESLSGYLWVGASALQGRPLDESYNFGPRDSDGSRTAGEIAMAAWRSWEGAPTPVLRPVEPSAREAVMLRLDVTLARQSLGWEPVWSVDRAVGEAMAWYRAHHEGDADPFQFTRDQIDEYVSDARRAGAPWAGAGSLAVAP